jgi:hypothetical protein
MSSKHSFRDWFPIVALHAELASRIACGGAADDELAAAAEAALTVQCERDRQATPLGIAATRLGLSPRQQLVLWTLVAHQLDPRLAAQLEGLAGNAELTLGALAQVAFADAPELAFDELGADGPLFRFALVERVDEVATEAWARRRVQPSDRLLTLATGRELGTDRGIAALLHAGVARRVDELASSPDALTTLRQAMRTDALVIVSGMPGLGRRTLATAVAAEHGVDLLAIECRRLARDAAALRKQLRALARECRLLRRAPLLIGVDALIDDSPARLELVGSELVLQLEGLVVVTCGDRRPALDWERPTILVELARPSSAQLATLWLAELGQGRASDGEHLATHYALAPALVHHAAAATRTLAAQAPITPEHVRAGVRAVLDERLGEYARRVTVTQTWDDLVLSEDQLDSVIELLARVRGRARVYEQWGFGPKVGKGLGVTALFSGPPGTGKTMLAALIARELGLELYQVDLGKIVSKWIGETEKHLGALFDAAEAGRAILLFDEADALFSKRTAVKSSNDRHANLETNYLLQRLESFDGVCLLTSNHAGNIDPAFQRRLSLHLRFELPDVDERAQLWRRLLPASAPVAGEIDYHALARRFQMSGGYIRNAVLRAGFLAADVDSPITAAFLERAARTEYEGMGRLAA